MRMHVHWHTHTHIQIYIYIQLFNCRYDYKYSTAISSHAHVLFCSLYTHRDTQTHTREEGRHINCHLNSLSNLSMPRLAYSKQWYLIPITLFLIIKIMVTKNAFITKMFFFFLLLFTTTTATSQKMLLWLLLISLQFCHNYKGKYLRIIIFSLNYD